MNKEQLDKIDWLLTSLINEPKYGTVGLSLNDYLQGSRGREPMRTYSVREMVEDEYLAKDYDWYSDEDTARAVAHNTFWSLYWYPDTPVGSYNSNAYDLANIVEQAMSINGAEGFDYELIHDFEMFLRSHLTSSTDFLTLHFNDHKTCYESTADRVLQIDVTTWVSEEERSKVLQSDRLWEVYGLGAPSSRGSTLATLFKF
jgi:hypothetical protein